MDIENCNILILDDHLLSCKLLRMQMIQYGVPEDKIHEFSSSTEALQKYKEGDFKIAIVDWDMPGMNGLEFIKKCKEHKGNDETAFVMASAEAQPDKILEALNQGVISYLTKPVAQDDVNEKMKKVMEWMDAKAS